MSQERDVFLNRALIELIELTESHYGLTVSELAQAVAERDSAFAYSLRTIRRDCQALVRMGWIQEVRTQGQPVRYQRATQSTRLEWGNRKVSCERTAILDRVAREVRALYLASGALSVRELAAGLSQEQGEAQLIQSERTIRRDCLALEYHGFLEHVSDLRNQKFLPSRRMRECWDEGRF